jgi:hypothetical protein
MSLPPYAPRVLVAERLLVIFPEGTPNRLYCVRELAASTVFSALYIGAIEDSGRYFGPIHVYRMTEEQASKAVDDDRRTYVNAVLKKPSQVPGRRWYADNTREPIRDETLRDGLVAVGAVIRREDLPTTSGLPRYALKKHFATLFDPALKNHALAEAISAFQRTHLNKSALARIAIIRAGATASSEGILVRFPNGETRTLAPGPSSLIAQSVIEVFAQRFLEKPAVLWLSESGNKIVVRDESIANAIGLELRSDENLPDIILADLGPREPLLVFVEVVATDGAIIERRQEAIYKITDAAGFHRDAVAFLTAYLDRESAGFRKTMSQLAWNSFAWFMSEPERIVILRMGRESALSRLSELGAVAR